MSALNIHTFTRTINSPRFLHQELQKDPVFWQ